MAEMMESKFGIPWMKVNIIGAEATAKSLRKIARYFDDPTLTARVEVDRGGNGRCRAGSRCGPRQGQRTSGHALRRRIPFPPLPVAVLRHWHADGGG